MADEPTAFQKIITRSYTDVQVTEEGINTEEFLEATDGMINMFGKIIAVIPKFVLIHLMTLLDLFGSSAFSIVQNDMSKNVIKIRTRFAENPKEYDTLEKLMAKEAHLKKRLATEALLWLKRYVLRA